MSIDSFIQAMPKAELYIQLEGGMQRDTMLLIAEQNNIPETTKHFQDWLKQLDKPNFSRLDELLRMYGSWVFEGEDITRIVYDLGVMLAKQNVRYAEVSVNPVMYMQNGLIFEHLLEALSDGRDRVQRGWGVRMSWILTIPRDEPRRSDEVARWATTAAARKAGVIALGLKGREDIQPAGQFERAFRNAEKKLLMRTAQAGDTQKAEGVLDVILTLNPDRIYDGWGSADAPDVLQHLRERHIPLSISLAKALCLGWVQRYADYPARHLYDEAVKLVIGTGLPNLYKTTINDEYRALVEHCGFSVEELQELALNALEVCFLPDEEKESLRQEFSQAYTQLAAEHIASESAN